MAFTLMGAAFTLHAGRARNAPPKIPTEEDRKAALAYVETSDDKVKELAPTK